MPLFWSCLSGAPPTYHYSLDTRQRETEKWTCSSKDTEPSTGGYFKVGEKLWLTNGGFCRHFEQHVDTRQVDGYRKRWLPDEAQCRLHHWFQEGCAEATSSTPFFKCCICIVRNLILCKHIPTIREGPLSVSVSFSLLLSLFLLLFGPWCAVCEREL